jgi:uncharacterized pyridoxal phosphate-containing UPF0001 family protein
MTADTASRLESVKREIAEACREAGRDPASVTLVAISKTFPAEAIERVIAAGQRVFGENRVQEARAKWPPLLARYGRAAGPARLPPPERGRVGAGVASPDPHPTAAQSTSPLQGEVKGGIELHLVGPLQSNKAKEAVALFDAIHSVDRASLCEALAKEIAKQNRRPTLFVEVNTGAEPQKAGVLPEETDAFVAACREKYGLAVSGLMGIPPLDEPPAPHFALLQKIAARNGLPFLSMGMSADFALAIRFGATHVRVGTAIFGARA